MADTCFLLMLHWTCGYWRKSGMLASFSTQRKLVQPVLPAQFLLSIETTCFQSSFLELPALRYSTTWRRVYRLCFFLEKFVLMSLLWWCGQCGSPKSTGSQLAWLCDLSNILNFCLKGELCLASQAIVARGRRFVLQCVAICAIVCARYAWSLLQRHLNGVQEMV